MGRSPALRWGVLGAGRIAATFVEALRVLPDAAVAVGSRDRRRAEEFGERHGVPRRHGSYEELVADASVDVVYVATPHSAHRSAALLALEAGKHVLCEKPFTVNAAQARKLVDAARSRKLFLMEGMWTRFTPAMADVRRLVADGSLGELRYLMADIGWKAPRDPASRLFDPRLGGGALLDIGVYGVSLASMLFGRPSSVDATGSVDSGVDLQTSVLLGHPGGAVATLLCTIEATTSTRAVIVGTEGRLDVPDWYSPSSFIHFGPWGGEARTVRHPQRANGMEYEAAEVTRRIHAGETESPAMPLDETVAIMHTLDTVRGRIGLRYPGEPGYADERG